jgi:hypothetical protein
VDLGTDGAVVICRASSLNLWPAEGARVRTHDVLGGLIREYELTA